MTTRDERENETDPGELRDAGCMEGEVAEAEAAALSDAGFPESFSATAFDLMEPVATADVFIQAGHFNTPDDRTGGTGPLGREIDWTPIVVNEATRILREAGISVVKEDASIKKTGKQYRVKVAIFIHFDASSPPSRAGASIGYDDASDKSLADAWRQLYTRYWKFRWMKDNYTKNLSGYYGYRHTSTTDGEVLLELGDLTVLEQAKWLKPRLKWLGALVAHFAATRVGSSAVPDPGPFT